MLRVLGRRTRQTRPRVSLDCVGARRPDPSPPLPSSASPPAVIPTPRAVSLRDHVQQHGWQVTGVIEEDDFPGWAYTVGLWHSYRSPEIAVLGLPTRTCMSIANLLAAKVRDGAELAPGRRLEDVLKGTPWNCAKVRGEWFPAGALRPGHRLLPHAAPADAAGLLAGPERALRLGRRGERLPALPAPAALAAPADHPASPWTTLAKGTDQYAGADCVLQGRRGVPVDSRPHDVSRRWLR